MSLYRNILNQAWKITWNNKYLWFFGLFAALLASGGEYEILSGGFGDTTFQGSFLWIEQFKQTGVFKRQALYNLGDIAKNDTFSFIMILFILLIVTALALFLVWLSVVSQAALVNNTAKHLDNNGGNLKEGVNAGMKNFWPVLGLNVFLKLVVYIVFFLFGLPVIYVATRTGLIFANIFYICLFVIFIAVVLAVSFITKYATGYIVLKKEKISKAFKSSWKLFAKNWIVSMEMALILFCISLVVSLAYLLFILVFAIPFILLAVIALKLSVALFLFVMLLILAFYVLSLFFVGATLSTFQISSWTILFLQLLHKGVESKLARVVGGLLKS